MRIKLDYQIIICLALLCLISCFFIYSSVVATGQYSGAMNFVYKQVIFYIIGFIAMFLISRFDILQLRNISIILYIVIFLLLIGLIVLPESIVKPVNNAKAWYQIPLIGTIQPSEFLKFPLLLLVSWIIVDHGEKNLNNGFLKDFALFGKMAVISIPPMILVYIQPDTGMILLYLSMLLPLIFFSNVQKKIILFLICIPTIVVGFLIYCYFFLHDFYQEYILGNLSPHQVSRINGWLDPFTYADSAYQTIQGILAIGSGQTFGRGLMENSVYIPEKHTDFIFATIAEETGFLGASIVILILFLLIHRMVQISLSVNNVHVTLISVGIASLFTFQIFQNIGMTIGLLPVTGVTLPFLSYGGSSLLSNMMLMGIILSINNWYSNYMFKEGETEE